MTKKEMMEKLAAMEDNEVVVVREEIKHGWNDGMPSAKKVYTVEVDEDGKFKEVVYKWYKAVYIKGRVNWVEEED